MRKTLKRRINMKYNKIAAVLASVLMLNMTACAKTDKPAESAAPQVTTESNKAAIVGSWQLSQVLVSEKEGENPVEVKEEDHASMFEEKENVYTFNEDGTGMILIIAGPDKLEKEVTWVANPEGSFTVTDDGEEEFYLYDPVDDVLMREYIEQNPYIHVLTVFARQ